jgi:hypothetical protein
LTSRSALPRVVALLAASLALTVAMDASAQDDPCQPRDGFSTCFAADNLWLHLGGGRFVWQAPTQTTEQNTAVFGFALGYLHRPVGFRVASADPEGTTIYAVDNVASATLMAGLGVTERLQLGVVAPFVLYQRGASKADVIGSDETLPRSAVGDVRLGARFTLLERELGADGPGLAARFDIAAPTGNENAFVSSPTATWAPGLSFDYAVGGLLLGADLSARLRDDTSVAGTVIASQLGIGAGAGYAPWDDERLSVNLELYSLITLVRGVRTVFEPGASEPEFQTRPLHAPMEWMLSVRTASLIDGRFRASLGGGSFIPTGPDVPVTAPAFRFALGVHYVYE